MFLNGLQPARQPIWSVLTWQRQIRNDRVDTSLFYYSVPSPEGIFDNSIQNPLSCIYKLSPNFQFSLRRWFQAFTTFISRFLSSSSSSFSSISDPICEALQKGIKPARK